MTMRSISTTASGSAPRWSCCADRHRPPPGGNRRGRARSTRYCTRRGSRPHGRIAGEALGGEFLKIVAPHAVLPAAELEEIVPAEDAGGMQVVERQAHGVIADRVDLQDRHIALAGNGLALVRRVALNFGARTVNAQEFGRELERLAGLERHAKRRLVLAQPHFGRPSRHGSIGCGWHEALPDGDVAMPKRFHQLRPAPRGAGGRARPLMAWPSPWPAQTTIFPIISLPCKRFPGTTSIRRGVVE